ncbi:type II toxin-antitoxin system HicA family toxin [Nibribacter koreensis]|uniref:HicA toxin of toxin-antitoxin n=1 Tax=Nibribacter koreensis TaxID=1084519 RepID=A0ABP8G381_9BACT
MSKLAKLIERLLTLPKDFTWEELTKLLRAREFEEQKRGKTGGSRRRYVHPETGQMLSFHEPHPSNIVKEYVLKYVIKELDLD